MERVIISLNWACGTVLLAVALLYPFIHDRVLDTIKSNARTGVQSISRVERDLRDSGKPYALFTAGDTAKHEDIRRLNLVQDDFVYDAFQMEDGSLVIRAQVSPERIKNAWFPLPPLTYTLQFGVGGQSGGEKWEGVSDRSPGLF